MQLNFSPAIKGFFTAILMISIILMIYNKGGNADSRLQYLIYVIYGIGIVWTLVRYRQSTSFTGSFGNLFGQGFRCFIVVTLFMALFYGIFNYVNPEFAEEASIAYREQLEQSVARNERLPANFDAEVTTFKKQYTLRLVSGAIFGYLIIGAGVTAVLSALLARRK